MTTDYYSSKEEIIRITLSRKFTFLTKNLYFDRQILKLNLYGVRVFSDNLVINPCSKITL